MLKLLLVEKNGNSPTLTHLTSTNHQTRKIADPACLLNHVRDFNPDALVIVMDFQADRLLTVLQTLNCQLPLPVALIAPDLNLSLITAFIQAGVNALVLDNPKENRLDGIIQTAIAQFKQTQALKTAVKNTSIQLEDRKKIDRAKAILIKTHKLSEDAAYQTLRKLAMDRKISLGEMARNVIAMAELLN